MPQNGDSQKDDFDNRDIGGRPHNWTDREMERLARNQHDLRNSINAMQLSNVEAIARQTGEISERIQQATKETSHEISEAIKNLERGFKERTDKLETDLKGNATQVTEIKVELTTIKVKVAMWCAIGASLASIISAVITAVVIHAVSGPAR